MTASKKPGVAFWAIVVVVVVLLYVASFGPACWITSRLDRGADLVPVVYRPLTWAMSPDSETTFNRVSMWYAKIGAPENWVWGAVWDPDVSWMWVEIDPRGYSMPTALPAYPSSPPSVEPGDSSPEDASSGNLAPDD
jgi:hypothetical protein